MVGDGSEEQRPLGPSQLQAISPEAAGTGMREVADARVTVSFGPCYTLQSVGEAEMERGIGASQICFPLRREESKGESFREL